MNLVCLLAREARGDAIWPLEGPISLTIVSRAAVPASWSRKRREAAHWRTSKPDADNTVKLVADGLTRAGVWRDDAQVVRLEVEKSYCLEGEEPGTEVVVDALETWLVEPLPPANLGDMGELF